jgi:hypothetical protein
MPYLSYSAWVAEQFSSSYHQTPSQEPGPLDAARLAQFNQTGAPSGSMSPGAVDAQLRLDRLIRPSEMKDEGCVFPPSPAQQRRVIPHPHTHHCCQHHAGIARLQVIDFLILCWKEGQEGQDLFFHPLLWFFLFLGAELRAAHCLNSQARRQRITERSQHCLVSSSEDPHHVTCRQYVASGTLTSGRLRIMFTPRHGTTP